MSDASDFVRVVQKRQGLLVGSIEETAYSMGYITGEQLSELARPLMNSGYGVYLMGILEDGKRGKERR